MPNHNMARGVNVYRAGPRGEATRTSEKLNVIVNVDSAATDRDEREGPLPPLKFGFASTEADK